MPEVKKTKPAAAPEPEPKVNKTTVTLGIEGVITVVGVGLSEKGGKISLDFSEAQAVISKSLEEWGVLAVKKGTLESGCYGHGYIKEL
jgi:hypothetical protein